MCLDVNPTHEVKNVELWECTHQKTQKWYWEGTYLKNLGYKGQTLDIYPKKGLFIYVSIFLSELFLYFILLKNKIINFL